MSEETKETKETKGKANAAEDIGASLIAQAEAALKKQKQEALLSKVKEVIKERDEAEKAVKNINLKLQKLIEDGLS